MSSKEKDTENVEKSKKDKPRVEKIEENTNDSNQLSHEEKIAKKGKNKNMGTFIGILTIIIVLAIFSTIFAIINLGKNTIARGVMIKGIDVSNLTITEATNKMKEATNIELMQETDIIYNEDYKLKFDANQIQYEYDILGAVKQAYNVGKDKNIIVNNYTLLYSAFAGKNIEMNSTYNESSLNGIVEDIASKIPGLVVQSSYYIEEDELIIDKGQAGISVKKDKLKQDILDSINNRKALEIIDNRKVSAIKIETENAVPDAIDIDKIYGEVYCVPEDAYYVKEPFQIFPEKDGIDFAISLEEAKNIVAKSSTQECAIPLKFTPAKKTINDIGTEAFPYMISSYTTKYDASNINRSGNLKIAAEKINGTVLMPGEEFSFNEVVGKRTIEEGYKNAKIYQNGQVVDGLAGGICQISSTLYNAVLLANLEVTVRRNHSYTATYVPAGRDATVVYGTQDFKFKNSRTYPIKIEANVANGIVAFNIHGIKEEVEYEIKIIPVTTKTIPYQTEYVPTPGLAPGQQVVKQAGHSGYNVTTYIQRRIGGTVISKDIISNDTYNPMKAIINIGM